MREHLEHWLTERKSLFVPPVALILIAGFWIGLQPQPLQVQDSRSARIQEQWRKLLPLRATLQDVGIEAQPQIFSPVDLPVAGASLIAWRPVGRGGEMQLEVDWQAVPALFSWLARCGMGATAFTLRPEKQALQLSLQLEAEDAP